MNIGLYIKHLRTSQNKTLHQVAVNTNIDATLLSKIERGSRFATDEQLLKLAQFFDIPLENLQSKAIAEKIIKEYGLNEITLNALHLVQEKFETYKITQND
jgi:HTH-type transcriptional regulator, competence development regulator